MILPNSPLTPSTGDDLRSFKRLREININDQSMAPERSFESRSTTNGVLSKALGVRNDPRSLGQLLVD